MRPALHNDETGIPHALVYNCGKLAIEQQCRTPEDFAQVARTCKDVALRLAAVGIGTVNLKDDLAFVDAMIASRKH